MTDITVPTLGESITEATVGQWLKAEGDAVKKDDVLVELETDKVSVEVSATEDGVLGAIVAKPGDTVEIGAVLKAGGMVGAAVPAWTLDSRSDHRRAGISTPRERRHRSRTRSTGRR